MRRLGQPSVAAREPLHVPIQSAPAASSWWCVVRTTGILDVCLVLARSAAGEHQWGSLLLREIAARARVEASLFTRAP